MWLFEILLKIIYTVSFISVIGALVVWKRFTKVERIFGIYIMLSSFFELVAWITSEEWSKQYMLDLGFKNNMPGLHLFTLIKFIVLWSFFCRIFKSDGLKIPGRFILILGIVAIVLTSLFVQGVFMYNAYSSTAIEMGIMLCSMIYFYRLVLSDQVVFEEKGISFFVIAVFINAALSIIISLFSLQILEMEQEVLMTLWNFKTVVNICTQVIIIFGLYIIFRRKKLSIISENVRL